MFFSKDKVKKLKTEEDVRQAYYELHRYAAEIIDFDSVSKQDLKTYFLNGYMDSNTYISKLMRCVDVSDYDGLRELSETKFKYGHIDYRQYMIDMIQIDYDEAIEKNTRKQIGSSLQSNTDNTIDPYVKDNIDYQYNKAMLELQFRLGDMDNVDYELQLAELNNEAYAKVFFEPVDGGKSSELSIDVRFNDFFVDELTLHEGITATKDDDGNLDKDDIVEQWFHTAIIVLAANMLKENDLDSFRSVTEDHAGVSIIEELEFDDEAISQLDDEQKQRIEQLSQSARVYK